MKRVHSSESLAEIGHLKNLLEQAGIACVIRNQELSGALGEVPFLDCLPELWILDDAALADAQALLDAQRSGAADAACWRCTACSELNEGQFAVCWRCGTSDSRG